MALGAMISKVLITLGIVFSVALIHVAYVDFRFRHRGSVLWFWMAGPAPPLLIASRFAAAAALVAALATGFLGATRLVALILGGLMLIHLGTLAVLEFKEER
jgi:hypothetical protein